MSLSVSQITAQLEAVLASDASARAVAIRADHAQPWPPTVRVKGRQFAIQWRESQLAMRDALAQLEMESEDNGLALVTPLRAPDLAEDIVARLARRRVFQPEGWEMVRQLFGANKTDARLGAFPWMPQLLMDGSARGPFTPVPNGFLDLETAWREILQRFLALSTARPDAITLLRWTMTSGNERLLDPLPPPARAAALAWLGQSAGVEGALILACVKEGRALDAVPLGLVCGVVFSVEGEGVAELAHAAIRLERYIGGVHLGLKEGRRWAEAAQSAIADPGNATEMVRPFLDRAEALLAELRVAEWAHLSAHLPSALEERLRTYAEQLASHAEHPSVTTLSLVEGAAVRVTSHALARNRSARFERMEMSGRLARWLTQSASIPSSVEALLCWQADEGAFVDWAKFRLLGGDELPELSAAYSAVRSAVVARRQAIVRRFSELLPRWNAQMQVSSPRVVPIESILDRVVAPMAASSPVLMLVMDGMSGAIFRELFAMPEHFEWTAMVRTDQPAPLIGIAAFPTITEVSRASLLSGALTTGAAPQEKAAFATHAALLASSVAGLPPRLFHKGDLAEATNFAQAVRDAIANPKQKVIGIVHKAVDDHLSGPDQLHQRWSLEELRLLMPLLHEARMARRVIVVTADHGHVLDDGSIGIGGAESDRWRAGSNAARQEEIVLKGGRVRVPGGPGGEGVVVCLWDEGARYGNRKNGYHGGASLQEVTVPIGIMVPSGLALPGWQPAPPARPEWWDMAMQSTVEIPHAMPVPEAAARRTPRRAQAPIAQGSLFDDNESKASAQGPGDWVSALFKGAVYQSQRRLAARVAPNEDVLRVMLESLAERGGKLSRTTLAQRLNLPEMRLGGLLSAARRILNVDQAAFLEVNDAAGMVELNQALLARQFDVDPR